MFGQLVPCGGGDPIPLHASRLVVGRRPGCDVTLPFAPVSSKHCLLEMRDGVWFVVDLGSRNGVRVDGKPCQEAQLSPGCILSVAHLRYHVEYATKGSATWQEATAARPVAETTATQSMQPLQSATEDPALRPVTRRGGLSGELIPCGGGVPIRLSRSPLIVGRASGCDITIPHPTVSSKHCQLEFKEGYWHVRDLGSRNGIRVDGHIYTTKYLRPGEILSIATQRFEVAYTPQADESPPDENPFALSLLEKLGVGGKGASGGPPQFSRTSIEDEPRKRWNVDER